MASEGIPIGQPGQMHSKPACCLVIGMAGSGKTTLMQAIAEHVRSHQLASYFVNLDPAVKRVDFGANIDIRDTVDYKQVMKQYSLGPNGGIMTALNLFATRFDQVISLIEKRAEQLDLVFVDTPGQIEAFTWSASGAIVTESLATTFPTVVIYVVDTPRSASPSTFMSNMLYACSILYKTKLPFIIVFNKTDVISHDFLVTWMTDYEAFQDALDREQDQSYFNSFTRSMSLVLEEFYSNLRSVGVSAATGDGLEELFGAIQLATEEFETHYRPEIMSRIAELQKQRENQQMVRLQQDLADEGETKEATGPVASPAEMPGSGPVEPEATSGSSEQQRDPEEEAYQNLLQWVTKQKELESLRR